jgi:flagellar assembly factor FliW
MTGAAMATAHPAIVASEVLGELHVAADQVVALPDGLYGFPTATRFALLPAPREGLFWLQSLDHTALAFLLVDPFLCFPDYQLDLGVADKARIATQNPEDILVLAIVTLPAPAGGRMSANLHAPLLLNVRAGHGYQSIRPDDTYGIREEFDL